MEISRHAYIALQTSQRLAISGSIATMRVQGYLLGHSLLSLYISSQLSTGQLPPSGFSGTVPLAKITVGGTDGSLTATNGLITAVVNPT